MAVESSNSQVCRSTVDYAALENVGRDLLVAIGEDPTRPGLLDTPRRFAASWREFIEYDPGVTDTVFESVTTNQMVVIAGMKVWSMCEHHMLPFWCKVNIGYIARDKVLGLSKFARVAHQFAHKLQLQERLIHEIADEIQRITETPDVAVMGQGEHLCMVMRGVQTPGLMTTSVMRGLFFESPSARSEFMSIIR